MIVLVPQLRTSRTRRFPPMRSHSRHFKLSGKICMVLVSSKQYMKMNMPSFKLLQMTVLSCLIVALFHTPVLSQIDPNASALRQAADLIDMVPNSRNVFVGESKIREVWIEYRNKPDRKSVV